MLDHLLVTIGPHDKWVHLLDDWGEDSVNFLRTMSPRSSAYSSSASLSFSSSGRYRTSSSITASGPIFPSGLRAQQLRTLAGVIYSIGIFLVLFYAAMSILPILGLNIGPLLASAGVAGFAIGFGAQTLVKDFINGFFILIENTFDVGDVVRTAGVQGTVESLTLRRTMLRDADGTVHMVPNSQMTIISNLTRDWTQLTMHVAVDYQEIAIASSRC